jgi:hypothetical protein
MKLTFPLLLGKVLVILLFLLPQSIFAQSATQSITLVPGWNAVWLEVTPTVASGNNEGLPQSPEEVFRDHPIIKVLSPKPLAGTAEFFADGPSDVTTFFNQPEWEQWHKQTQLGDNLASIIGNRPYLIQTDQVATLQITGTVRFHRPNWAPDRYNLVGFGLQGIPTFESFFAASGTTHPTNQIYRLIPRTGNWVRVDDPTSETMNSNECYWVFSAGVSNYMGPVAVDFKGSTSGTLSFGGPDDVRAVGTGASTLNLDLEEITFTNLSNSETSEPALDLINLDDESGTLALRAVTPDPDSLRYIPGNLIDTIPGPTANPSGLAERVAPLSSATLTIGASREWTTGRVARTNVYRLQTGAGSAFWLPVRASLNSVQLASDTLRENEAAVAGLWVGEVSVTGVASIVEDGSPVRTASVPAPIQILLHSDASGRVNLLSQVTIMQTRTADPSIPSVPVLVVDPARIPFFEGIEERNGKLAGLRLESVAFDMPRDIRVASQSDSDPTGTQLVSGTFDSQTATSLTDDDVNFTNVLPAGSRYLVEITGATASHGTVVEVNSWSNHALTGLSGVVADDATDYTIRAAKTDLIDNITAALSVARASVDESGIDSYLVSSGQRPPTLKEVYHQSLLCDGAIGPGKTVQTRTGSLNLDGFHRSNPFRHAFHQRHGKGPKITREFSIVFDPEQSVPDQFTGTYEEQVTGLTRSRITLQGSIRMSRVSAVDTLEGGQ